MPGTRPQQERTSYTTRLKHSPPVDRLLSTGKPTTAAFLASPRPSTSPWLPSASLPCSSSLPLPSLPLRPGRCVLPWRRPPPATRVTPSCRVPNRGSAPTAERNRPGEVTREGVHAGVLKRQHRGIGRPPPLDGRPHERSSPGATCTKRAKMSVGSATHAAAYAPSTRPDCTHASARYS